MLKDGTMYHDQALFLLIGGVALEVVAAEWRRHRFN
jgi:hypothetical protein